MVYPLLLPSSYGGIKIATLALSKELKTKCDVRIHTLDINQHRTKKFGYVSDRLPREELIEGVPVFRYPCFEVPLLRYFSPGLIEALRYSKGHIIHIQGAAEPLIGYSLQKLLPTPRSFVLTAHTLNEVFDYTIKSMPGGAAVRSIYVSAYFKRLNSIIALSQHDRQRLLSLGYPDERISVIPNGVNVEKFLKTNSFVAKGEIDILCVGRFEINKGYEDLIAALETVKKERDFTAYFIGPVVNIKYFSFIKNLIKQKGLEKQIKIFNSVTDSDLTDCYRSAKVFVLASHMETLPLVIMEAMYCGLPVVACRVGGIPDLVKNSHNGFLVEAHKPGQLCSAILRLLNDDSLSKEIGQINKEAAKEFTWQAVAETTFNLYQALEKNIVSN